MLASVPTSTLLGVEGHPVTVEIHVANGLPSFSLVGLPDAACREARDRVRSAVTSSDYKWPKTRTTANLAPSNLRKIGSAFDLAIAAGILVAAETLKPDAIRNIGFLGELGLDGTVRSIEGVVPLVASMQCDKVVVPAANVDEAAVASTKTVLGVSTLKQLVAALVDSDQFTTARPTLPIPPEDLGDLSDVHGQPFARWAAEVCAAGGHNMLLIGPPGSGKTMLARRIPGLLPPLSQDQTLAATRVHSAAGLLSRKRPMIVSAPFRAPHHTASAVSIAGGGTHSMRPGEASLAHGGVLFLDEMAEFSRSVLDVLRQPLEEGVVRVARAHASVALPAEFLLIGATNPCPCGEGLVPGRCRCGFASRNRYMARLSGPLIDRFDLRVPVHRPDPERFFGSRDSDSSAEVRQRVEAVRYRARQRGVICNARLSASQLDAYAPIDRQVESVLMSHMRQGSITARGLDRIRRVALTLSDLDDDDHITVDHVCAALQLRPEFKLEEDAA